MLDGLLSILQTLLGWLFLLVFQLLLGIVDLVESFFDIFAGTQKVYYYNKPVYLFDLFFSNAAITNLFWAMAIIAIILSFGFCIVAVARKVTDVAGTTKHTLGQIISNFIRSLVVILLLNISIIAAINVTNVVFDRINYSLEHATSLNDGTETVYTDEEFATMARILATIGNYSANPSAESRYNVNACFNAIRGEMTTLYTAGCFNYDFPLIQEGKHTWQSALAQIAKAANLSEDLQLDTYYPSVQQAIILCFDQLKTNPNFKPQETAVRQTNPSENMTTAQMIFLAASMGAEENKQFRNGSYDDALRRSYLNGEKDMYSYDDVNEDFAITEINYVMGIIVAICIILFLAKVVLLLVVRMFNILMLYVVSPLFASSMTLDEGSRFQNWIQSFVMQLLAAYGGVVMMRIYLLIIPTVLSSDLDFFIPGSIDILSVNIYGQLLIVLAGAWAVSRASTVIAGALTGNAASAFLEADSMFGRNISDFMGAGRLYNEIGRRRMNADRRKNHEKANQATKNKENGGSGAAATENRNKRSTLSDKQAADNAGVSIPQGSKDDTYVSNEATRALERTRQSFDMDNGVRQGAMYNEDNGGRATSMARMRAQAGLGNPVGTTSVQGGAVPARQRTNSNTQRNAEVRANLRDQVNRRSN